MKPIVFLDIDGVIVTPESRGRPFANSHNGTCWDLSIVQRFHNFVRETNVDVVISSDWREDMSMVNAIFAAFGLDLPIGHTRLTKLSEDRGGDARKRQILEFVNEHNPPNWAVLDDLPMDFGEHDWRFIQTNPDIGLTANDVKHLTNIFRWHGTKNG